MHIFELMFHQQKLPEILLIGIILHWMHQIRFDNNKSAESMFFLFGCKEKFSETKLIVAIEIAKTFHT